MLYEWLGLMYWQGPVRGVSLGFRHMLGRLAALRDAPVRSLFAPASCGAGRLGFESGVPLAQFRGSHAEIGRQHGTLLRSQIQVLKHRYLDHIFPTERVRAEALAGGRTLLSHCPPGYQDELKALAAAAGLTPDDAVLLQTFPDTSKILLCTTVALGSERTRCGRPLMGRNLDFPSFGISHRYSMVSVHHPTGGMPFAAIGWPGMIGVLSGMNAAGLSAATMLVYADGEHFEGMPSTILYRELLGRCTNVGEARDFLSAAHAAGTNNLMLMDAAGRSMVAELNPAGNHFRTDEAGILYSANHHVAEAHRQDPWCPRFLRLRRVFRGAPRPWTLRELQRLMHGVNQGALTLQSMIFLPREKRLMVAVGRTPSSRRPYAEIDLGRHFAEGAAA